MTLTLERALEQVALAPGQTYRCRVNGMRVELRVIPEVASVVPAPISESDIVLDPWTEFPLPAGVQVQVRSEAILLPDPPDIPAHDERWRDE